MIKQTVQSVLESGLKSLPGTRIARAPADDPERASAAPQFNVFCRSEQAADQAVCIVQDGGFKVTRTGPNTLFVDTNPTWTGTANPNYSSVWED